MHLVLDADADTFLFDARLRDEGEILDALDIHYRLHWLIRQTRLKQQDIPAQLNPDIIFERHYALNWLVQYEGVNWDDVDTPT